ncbi:hypothetical protein J3F83DRAFT_52505 [Trichoderma novae-zelandiae]
MACQDPVCRECGSSKGLSHDRPSLCVRRTLRRMLSHRTEHVRVTTELAPSCPVHPCTVRVCARERATYEYPTRPGTHTHTLKESTKSGPVSLSERTAGTASRPHSHSHPSPSPALLLLVPLRKNKHDDITPYFACPHHVYCEQGSPVDQEGSFAGAPHSTGNLGVSGRPALGHLTSSFCALTCCM